MNPKLVNHVKVIIHGEKEGYTREVLYSFDPDDYTSEVIDDRLFAVNVAHLNPHVPAPRVAKQIKEGSYTPPQKESQPWEEEPRAIKI